MTDFQSVRNSVSLEAIARQYTELNNSLQGPCPLCRSGSDRFYIHIGGQRWGCRKCNEKGGDVIDLICAVENITPIEAIERLSGNAFTKPEYKAKPRTVEAKPEGWSARQLDVIKHCATVLKSPSGECGRDYLALRSIEPETWKAFGCGFDPERGDRWDSDSKKYAEHRPAICIPWLTESRDVDAVKFRFIDEIARNKKRRFSQVKHSDPRLFGAHLLRGEAKLIAVEGEVNGMSLWQDCHSHGFDVVSVGSDNTGRAVDELRELANRYEIVVPWFDDPAKAADVAKMLGESHRGVFGMQSPGGRDANDLLRQHGGGVLLQIVTLRIESDRKLTMSADPCTCPTGSEADAIRNKLGIKTAGQVVDSRCSIHGRTPIAQERAA